MNRALSFFVLFCLLLLCCGFLVAWWLGPQLVSLAFDSQRSQAPFYSLYLQHQGDAGAAAAASHEAGYKVQLLQLLTQPAGSESPAPGPVQPQPPPARVLWQSSSLDVVTGTVEDSWSNAVLAEFPSGRQFVRLATSPDYRSVREAAPKGRRVVVGSSSPPLRPMAHPAAVLLLAGGGAQDALDTWVDQLVTLGGEVLWDAPVVVLEPAQAGSPGWDHLLLVGFANGTTLATWAFSVEAQTANALLGAQAESMNLWLLQHLR